MPKNSEKSKGFKMTVKNFLLTMLLASLAFTQLNAYDGRAAARYALKHVYNHNSAYRYYDDADCTNFVSQAMKKGGMTDDRYGRYNWQKWTKYSPSWQLAPVLEKRFRKDRYSNGRKVARYIAAKNDLYAQTPYSSSYRGLSAIRVGDIIFFDWNQEDGGDTVSPAIEHYTHSAIVTYAYYGFVYVTYHSTDSKDVYLGRLTSVSDRWKCYRPVSMY